METGNREEAERAIRESKLKGGTPEDPARRRDTVRRAKTFHRRKKVIMSDEAYVEGELNEQGKTNEEQARPYTASGTYLSSDDDGVHGHSRGERVEGGTEAFDEAESTRTIPGDEETEQRSSMLAPNDDMAGQGWTPPVQKDAGWEHPDDLAPEEDLHTEDHTKDQ